jgi:uncharacterized membrane protein (UPF0127 family)
MEERLSALIGAIFKLEAMKSRFAIVFVALVACGCSSQTPEPTPQQSSPLTTSTEPNKPTGPVDSIKRTYHLSDLRQVTLKANNHEIRAWVMDTDGKREEGMKWLTDKNVKDDEGMIFLFPEAKQESFWMENTILPLDIVFISGKNKVLNIQEGTPGNLSPLPSNGPALNVLELKQGTAARLGIKPGTEISIPDDVKGQ